jgi:hypothetical protein
MVGCWNERGAGVGCMERERGRCWLHGTREGQVLVAWCWVQVLVVCLGCMRQMRREASSALDLPQGLKEAVLASEVGVFGIEQEVPGTS